MNLTRESLRNLFSRGDHRAVVSSTIDGASGPLTAAEAGLAIGSLAFLGRIDEARVLYTEYGPQLTLVDAVEARTYLGFALCRHSAYAEAIALFAENLRLGRRVGAPPRVRSQAFLGLAFYRFFQLRYRQAQRAGEQALAASLVSGSMHGKLLAHDLLGHVLIHTGQIERGLEALRQAESYAKALGQGGSVTAVRVATANYEAQFGLKPAVAIAQLEALIKASAPEDTYSQASLLLELSRQYTLRGDLVASQRALNDASPAIHRVTHRRQNATLNLRYAHNAYLAGRAGEALNLIRNAARDLNPTVDLGLQVEAMGLERAIRRLLGHDDHVFDETKLSRLTAHCGRQTSQRIQARLAIAVQRSASGPPAVAVRGEDPLGDLLDRIATYGLDAVPEIMESGYFGLLGRVVGLEQGAQALVFGLSAKTLVIADAGSFWRSEAAASPALVKLARLLSQRTLSKEELVQDMWGYRFQGLRHDSLIHSLLSRFRQLLGERSHWLELTDHGYRLKSGVTVCFPRAPATLAAKSQRPALSSAGAVVSDSGLNHRQLKIWRDLRAHEFIDAQRYCQTFAVSRITAARDLTGMTRIGLLKRIGKGRATQYQVSTIS